MVAPTTLVMYLLLFIQVQGGSQTIDVQRRDLNETVAQLTAMNARNDLLNGRVRRAAASVRRHSMKRICVASPLICTMVRARICH